MAKGFLTVNDIFDDGDSRPLAPKGAGLDPSPPERVYVHWITATVKIPGQGTLIASNGNTGDELLRMDMSVPNNHVENFYPTGHRLYSGRALDPGNPLLITVTGGQATVECGYEVR